MPRLRTYLSATVPVIAAPGRRAGHRLAALPRPTGRRPPAGFLLALKCFCLRAHAGDASAIVARQRRPIVREGMAGNAAAGAVERCKIPIAPPDAQDRSPPVRG